MLLRLLGLLISWNKIPMNGECDFVDVALLYCKGGAFVGAHEHSRQRRPFQYIAAKYPQLRLQYQHYLEHFSFVLV